MKNRTTIVIAHRLSTIRTARKVYVLDKGKIVASGSPRQLIEAHSTREVAELRFGVDENAAVASKLTELAERVEVLPDRVLLYTEDGDEAVQAAHCLGLRPEASLVRRSSLEDVFLRLTGRSLVE